MSDRQRRIRAEWGQIQSVGRDLEKVADLLNLTRETLSNQLEPLKLSVEGGCIEYKIGLVNSVFRELENERYKSLPAATLDKISTNLGVLAYVALVQQFLADGQLPLRDHAIRQSDDSGPVPGPAAPEIKEIIAEVQQRVKEDPEIKTRQPVKNILMQLARYSKEMNEFREITSRIPKDKAAAVGVNFRKTTEEIFASIRRNYGQLVEDDQSAVTREPQNILLRVDLKSMISVYQRQAREASAAQSTLQFARDEQYGTRELLIELAARHSDFEKLVQSEQKRYEELGGTATVAKEIASAFGSEIGKRILREVEYF